MRRPTTLAAVAIAAALTVGVSACSTESDDDAPGDQSAAAESGALPVTITHTFGSTDIKSEPKRVAALGVGDAETLLALGITPTTAAPFGNPDDPSKVETPWNEKYLQGKVKPVGLGSATSDLSAVIPKALATNPDLIVAVNNAVAKSQYDTLSKVAPTITHSPNQTNWLLPWKDSTTEIGKAVGKPRQTAALVASTKALFENAQKANPQLAGRTAAVVVGGTDGSIYVYSDKDGRGQMLTNLGLEFPDSLKSTISNGFYGQLSAENLSMLNQLDKIVVVDYQGSNERLKNSPAFANLAAVKAGKAIFVDAPTGAAMSVPTVLSIPYALSNLVPQLAH